MSWNYKTHTIGDITQFPENTFGFVYIVTHKPSGKSYIGKKVLFHNKKQKIGKRELEKLQGVVGRRPSYKLVVKESDWLKYTGSHTFLKEIRKENRYDELRREILLICFTKKILTYNELKYQMMFEVLEESSYLNDNLLGKFYRKDFIRENESKSIIS